MFYKFMIIFIGFFLRILFRIKQVGEFDDSKESYIICANHSNLLDPLFLAIVHKRPIHFMAKEELFKNKLMAKFLKALNAFPVDRQGNDLKALKGSVKLLKNNNILGIFIEGTRVKKFDLANAKKGPILIANLANREIVPVKIETNYKLFSTVNIIVRDAYTIDKEILSKEKDVGYQKLAEDVLNIIYKGDKN